MKSPILDELHAIREQQLAEAGGTLEGLVAQLQADQRASGRTIRKAPRAAACNGASKPSDVVAENQAPPRDER